jgi:hypothetical protein
MSTFALCGFDVFDDGAFSFFTWRLGQSKRERIGWDLTCLGKDRLDLHLPDRIAGRQLATDRCLRADQLGQWDRRHDWYSGCALSTGPCEVLADRPLLDHGGLVPLLLLGLLDLLRLFEPPILVNNGHALGDA